MRDRLLGLVLQIVLDFEGLAAFLLDVVGLKELANVFDVLLV